MAKHCVGPLPLRRDPTAEALLGVPRRDHKVNSPVKVACAPEEEGGAETLETYGSCFADGIVRYPRQPPCRPSNEDEKELASIQI